jgi:cytochrome c oxidase subunit 2
MKLLYGAIVLAFAPLLFAGNGALYPSEKIAAFVFEKVDVTTLPSAIRPKVVKSKKTFGDYGYVAREVDERKALLDSPQGAPKISIEVLEAQKSGIFVCVNSQASGKSGAKFQRVLLLRLKDGLLKGRETWKEFDACPVIGGGDQDSSSSNY